MKNLKVTLTLACLSIAALSAQASSNQITNVNGSNIGTPDQQQQAATDVHADPGVMIMDSLLKFVSGNAMTPRAPSKGLQFKDPIISSALSYNYADDSGLGGFTTHTGTGELGFDVDIYDGLIAGALYQHGQSSGDNDGGTSVNLASDGFSVYVAKRLFKLWNFGLAYNHVEIDQDLSRAVKANLDRHSDGFTMFAGFSDRHGKWSYGSTVSFDYQRSDYDAQKDLDLGRFGWGGNLGYDITKWMTLSGVFNYYTLPIQDTFANSSVRDDDYWTLGPTLRFYPTKDLVINFSFDSNQGWKDLTSYTMRLGAEYSF